MIKLKITTIKTIKTVAQIINLNNRFFVKLNFVLNYTDS